MGQPWITGEGTQAQIIVGSSLFLFTVLQALIKDIQHDFITLFRFSTAAQFRLREHALASLFRADGSDQSLGRPKLPAAVGRILLPCTGFVIAGKRSAFLSKTVVDQFQ